MQEECGITIFHCVEVYKRAEWGDGPTGEAFYSTCFYAVDWRGVPKDSEEGSVAWLTPEEVTCSKAAFGEYNRKTLDVFKTMYPNVFLKGE